MKRLCALAAALLLAGACSSERSVSPDTTAPAADTTLPGTETTVVPPTTEPATTTTAGAPTTTAACTPEGDTAPQESDDPLLMSALVGVDIRTGIHPCFERLVIELAGAGDFPGWSIAYVDDPVRLGESDEFVEIEGAATLQVTMRMWMPTMEGQGYAGPIQVFPDNVVHILELRETENFEGMCIWSIGLDAEYPFTVDILSGPDRLVIDFHVPAGG